MKTQLKDLKDLACNDMLRTLFPNLSKLHRCNTSLNPVMTASVQRSFSQIKLIKTRLKSTLNDENLSNLTKSL